MLGLSYRRAPDKPVQPCDDGALNSVSMRAYVPADVDRCVLCVCVLDAQELTEKPKRILSRTLLLQVICIGTMSEFVLLFRRWELYLVCLVCQFVALVATHAWAYTKIAVAQNKTPE